MGLLAQKEATALLALIGTCYSNMVNFESSLRDWVMYLIKGRLYFPTKTCAFPTKFQHKKKGQGQSWKNGTDLINTLN